MKNSINFWNWFIKNQETLKNFYNHEPQNRIATLNKLGELLHSELLNLGYVIVLNKYNTTAELIITTNGNNENFKKAIQLIEVAPKVEGWIFTVQNASEFEVQIALKELDECYILGEITLKTDNRICIPLHAQNTPEKQLFVYYKNQHIYCQKQNLNHTLFTIIDKSIGNVANSKHINFVQLAQEMHEADRYTELYDFEYYLEVLNKNKKRIWK
ncbi:hypothetical protein [Flavobacterium tegetincola]|uniref:hypothetical protein n=1 Tax=Flavobacterium tegetincola TaxID=150172 RepID=UPI0004159C94|nr:hypothetical protein [Flavobacterium tegetincola]